MGPQLDRVNERLRPDYVLHWVGNPKRTLPYTGMPVNIPFDKRCRSRFIQVIVCSNSMAWSIC